MAESTLVQKFFQELEDPFLYEKVVGVPIFTPHVATKKNQKTGEPQQVEVDADKLKAIAKKLGDMEREKGVLPIITPGHRNIDPNFPEQSQPKPWGYAKNAEFGHYITPDGKKVPALLTTHYYSRKTLAEDGTPANEAARTYPFRSVDFYSGSNEISGIALLRRDPALDMGLISYGCEGADGLFHYAEENVMPENPKGAPSMPDPTTPPTVEATPGSEMDNELTPEEAHTAMRYMSHYEKHHPVMQHMCQQYAMIGGGGAGGAGMGAEAGMAAGAGVGGAGAGAPMPKPASLSPTNGAPPAAGGMRPRTPEKKPGNANPIQNARGRSMTTTEELPQQYARELAIRDSHIEALQKEVAAMKADRAVEREQAQLLQYQAAITEAVEIQGCQFDGKKFLELHQKDAPEQFKAHLDFVCEMSPRAPVERMGRIFAGNGHEGAGLAKSNGMRADGSYENSFLERVYQYQRDTNELDFDRAKAAVLAKGA